MIIGIAGYAQVGKDTVFTEYFKPKGFKRLAFADDLKREVSGTFRVSADEIARDKEAWRPLLVDWGERRRSQDPFYWVNKVTNWIEPGEDYCITDVRYANEAMRLQELGGKIILVSRPGFPAANNTEWTSIDEIKNCISPLNHFDNAATKDDVAYAMASLVIQ